MHWTTDAPRCYARACRGEMRATRGDDEDSEGESAGGETSSDGITTARADHLVRVARVRATPRAVCPPGLVIAPR
jgi:hypothetical protein